MTRIIVDHEIQPAESACETWGDLLDTLDRRYGAAGRLLTAARFDGVDEPAFRADQVRARAATDFAVVEIDSSTPQALLRATLDEADRASASLVTAAAQIGSAFRGFDVASANEDLVQFAQGISGLVTLATVISQAINVPLDALFCDGTNGAEMIAELAAQTETLIGAQEIGDWITVADVVEYDLAPALARWPALFGAMRMSVDGVGLPGESA